MHAVLRGNCVRARRLLSSSATPILPVVPFPHIHTRLATGGWRATTRARGLDPDRWEVNASTLQAGVFGLRVVDRRAGVDGVKAAAERVGGARVEAPKTLADVDVATISEAARNLREEERARGDEGPRGAGSQELSEAEEQTVSELEARDREVRAHEQAHKAAAGDLAVGGVQYTYQTGPDGKRYAIGGSVDIRLQSGSTPEETVRNMERARRAANAPQSPSGPDRAVAAKAAQYAAAARREQQQAPVGALVDRSA